MAMEVLRPQDCLTDRFRTHPADVFCRRRILCGAGKNGRSGRKRVSRSEMKRNGPPEPRRSKSEENLRSSCSGGSHAGLVSGQVTILRRGESLDSRIRSLEIKKRTEGDADMMMLSGTGRLGPDPVAVPREEIKAFLTAGMRDVYAGSAFVFSPSPSDLPLPSFSKKSLQLSPVVDDSATRYLRRLLRLE
uniref:Uncharacterized protein n=1 Tax=Kalanchoe fedtschenkoi TaxID=63787 RepID=A0A7N0UE08_KALFE